MTESTPPRPRDRDWTAAAVHGVVTTRSASAAGFSRAALRWAERTGVLLRLKPGVYALRELWDGGTDLCRHALAVRAAQTLSPRRVAVAESAAALLDLPLPNGPPEKPRLVVARSAVLGEGPGGRGDTHDRRAWLAEDEVWVTADGLQVTTPARTVMDCGRHRDRPWTLAIADAAARRWRLRPSHVLDAAARHPFAPGHPTALWVGRLLSPVPESPLESLARAVVVLGGFPEPAPQVGIRTHRGWVRVDLVDEEAHVIVEADGQLKYATSRDLWLEKRREDALRDTGYEVIRFTHDDYLRPKPWLARYGDARRRAAARGLPTQRS